MNKILQNIKNLGLLYAVMTLFSIVPERMYENIFMEITHLILLSIVWYFFIKNISLFYEDEKIQKQNIIALLGLVSGYLGVMLLDGIVPQQVDDISLRELFLSSISLILLIIGLIYSMIVTFKLYKHTQIKAFLYYFVSLFFIYLMLTLEIYLSSFKYWDLIYCVYYCFLSLLFAKGVLAFYKKNLSHYYM